MIIDCGTCAARDIACGDCVVSVLLGPPGEGVDQVPAVAVRMELQEPEWQALAALAGSGLVPPLRLVPGDPAASATYSRGVTEGREATG